LFTVNQLSYVQAQKETGSPRANGAVSSGFELQALAIRTGRIYVQRLPELPERPIEIFMDIEGARSRL